VKNNIKFIKQKISSFFSPNKKTEIIKQPKTLFDHQGTPLYTHDRVLILKTNKEAKITDISQPFNAIWLDDNRWSFTGDALQKVNDAN
jgi:hypothetical protein